MASYALAERDGAQASQVSGPVEGVLNYISPIADKPHTYNYEPPAGTPRQNFENEAHRVTIEDMRGRERDFSLDRHGFEAAVHRSREQSFDNDETIREGYYGRKRSAAGGSSGRRSGADV